MIARDEEAVIGLALKSVMALVDEIIVVDTGSRDNTRIIAEGYGARVIDLPWKDDFAAARNAALAAACAEWILVMDADERLQPVRPVEFQRLLRAAKVAGYRLQLLGGSEQRPMPKVERVRLFRNHAEIRYRYPICEQIVPALSYWAAKRGLTISEAPLTILHERRCHCQRIDRRERNQRILRQAVADYPEQPYFEYQLASLTLVVLDDEVLPVAGLAGTLQNLERAWQKMQALSPGERFHFSYGPDLVAKIAACYLAYGRSGEAEQMARAGRELYGDHPSLLLQGIATRVQILQDGAASLAPAQTVRLIKQARCDIHTLRSELSPQFADPHMTRITGLYPLRYLGELALLEGRVAEASENFEKALTIDPAYSFAWLGLAECARYAGDRKGALNLYLRTVTENEWNHRAWLRGSSLLEELGFRDNAASWRRKVAVHFPEHPLLSNLEREEVAAGIACQTHSS
jgi:tetratricopeptide (TPR) repeat protein